MLIGPVFTREAVTAPRHARHYVARAVYVSVLFVLMCTGWQVLAGTQVVRNLGDMARFGAILFQLLAPLQLAVAVFFAALFAASSVAQEKDRRTLILLLMTDLRNGELVLGKLLASVLNVLVLLFAALPFFVCLVLFGGVELAQVFRVYAVTLASVLAAGSVGSTIALWRDKTFQSLALTVLVFVFWLVAWEIVARLPATGAGISWASVAAMCSPWRAVLEATRPTFSTGEHLSASAAPVSVFLLVSFGVAGLLSALAILRVRVWNPSREIRRLARDGETEERESVFEAGRRVPESDTEAVEPPARPRATARTTGRRRVWEQPVLWRELRTWAYGRKVVLIRLAYLISFVLATVSVLNMETVTQAGALVVLVPLFLVGLVLINAQAVTAVSTERDGKTLDLLLVTDLTPKEFVFGKLAGVFYNTKEMVVLPVLLCLALCAFGSITVENTVYLIGGLVVMEVFVAVLGLHCGLIHENSRFAIATSLGTVFFLFVGIAICMRIMIAFSGSFQFQLAPFLAFMLGGGVGLYVSLGARNASTAIFWASMLCPFLTFYAITSLLLGNTLAVFLVTAPTYLFATLTMLIPAISEFDVASGRMTVE